MLIKILKNDKLTPMFSMHPCLSLFLSFFQKGKGNMAFVDVD